MKQFKFYILTVLVALFIIPSVAFAVWWNPFTWFSVSGPVDLKHEKNNIPLNYTSETTPVYGVQLHQECFKKFNDFIKNYGADYSKCLAEFDFNEKYCGGLDLATKQMSNVNIIVVLDSSGSMSEEIDGKEKSDIAKSAVSDFLLKMPQGVNIGLVVYGHKGSNSSADKSLSCNGIEEVVKLGQNNSGKILSALSSFSPKGWTPIAGSFDFARNIFKNAGATNKNYLILVSDGAESCGGNAQFAVGNLKSEIANIKLDVIGFSSDSTTRDFLKGIAEQGGGSYTSATNSAGIAKAFNDELQLIKKDCLSITFFQMSSRYSANYADNLNCWLAANKKESSDFSTNVSQKSNDIECNQEMSEALKARQNDFWLKKDALKEKNDVIYNKMKTDYNDQLKVYSPAGR